MLGNKHLHEERMDIYKALAERFLQPFSSPVILIDWSQINEEAGFHILRASLASKGRAITIYEEVHPKSKSHNRAVHGDFLRNLNQIIPVNITPLLVTDAGFKNPWFKQVESLGWNWLGRIRHFTQFRFDNDDCWKQCRSMNTEARSVAQTLGPIELAKRNAIPCYAHIFKKKLKGRTKKNQGKRTSQRTNSRSYSAREREPWFLVTNLNLQQLNSAKAVKIYATRMQIEESFRDNKNQRIGLSLKESKSRNEKRLEVLLLVVFLTTHLFWLMGLQAFRAGIVTHYQANTVRKKAVLSMFNLGLQVWRKEPEKIILQELQQDLECAYQAVQTWR